MSKKLLLFLLALLPLAASADAVLIGNLYYDLKTEGGVNVAEVLPHISGNPYTGDVIIIPPTVVYDDVEYSVTRIGNWAFCDCRNLTSVTIPNSVTSIGKNAFKDCTMGSVTIPNSVTSIGDEAFINCTNLKSIFIGSGVKSIGREAFLSCDHLSSIACYAATVPTTGDDVFTHTNQNSISLYVPSSSIEAYKAAEPWSVFGKVLAGQVEIDGIYYQLNPVGNVAEVIKNPDEYTGKIVIPSKITCYEENWSVTSIGKSAFYECFGLTSVTIPNSVTSIETASFGNCPYLTSITIPNSVTNIGESAFWMCKRLTTITIPNSVTSIGEKAFQHCEGLTSVTIGNGVTSIGDYAFAWCDELNSIACYAATVPTTGDNVFFCITQSNVTLYVPSSSVEAYKAAEPWKNFKDVLAGQVEVDGIYYQLHPAENEAEVIKRPSGYYEGDIEIPSVFTLYDTYWFVTSIGEYAFNGCRGLTSVTIPDGVMSIGNHAFHGCSGLTSVTIGNSVMSIGNHAFYNCSGLTSVTIGNSVTSIGEYAFFDSSLTSVTIPNSVTSIGELAFGLCEGLTSIVCNAESVPATDDNAFFGITQSNVTLYVPSSSVDAYKAAEPWKNFKDVLAVQVEFDGIYYELHPDKHEAEVIKHPDGYEGDIVIPSTITYPAEGEDWSVTSIGEYAFFYCTGLTSVTIGNSVTSIGNGAFYDCYYLTSIDIPNSVESIGSNAFNDCTKLTSVAIPNSVESIGSNAFYNCTSLTTVTIGNSVTSIGNGAFQYCSGLTSIDIPNSVTSIGEGAFYNCYYLTSIDIPNSVESIGNNAFYTCTSLTTVTIGNSVTSIGGSAFSYCGLTSVTIGNGVESIGNNAFLGCKGLTSIAIPNSVTSIGEGAFSNCSGLTSITIGNSVTSIGDYAFNNCTELTSVAIPNSVESIGSNAFYNCTSLTTVTIGNSVTSIGGNAFSYCGLTSIDIPNSVTSIGEYAFFYCTSLTSVTIGNSVESIGSRAFGLCKGLTSITCYAEDVPETSSDAFNEIDQSKVTLSVPYSSVEAYKTTEPWSGFNIVALAVEIDIDGIYYSLNPETQEAEVIKHPDGYKGDIVIPSTVTFDKVDYSVTSIRGFAFSDCKDLTSVTIGNSVKSIGNYAFYNCTGLTSVTIPNSVRSIGNYAFVGCEGLISLVIGNSVKSIGNLAFMYCTGLTSITCYAESVPETSSYAFYRIDQSKVTLYVPWSSVEEYKTTEPWNMFKAVLPIEGMATITEAGWATLFLPFAASVPEGVTAYTITDVENGALVKEEVTGVIPSNTGVLLKGDAGEYVFEEAEEPEPIEANLLIGTTKDEGETFNEPGFKYYILANDAENGIGFYFQKDTNGKSALCGQYKAVLVLPEKTDAIGFRLDGATMIEAVEAPADDAVIYDLTGRRVQDATGGIYIVNGKKVLVK